MIEYNIQKKDLIASIRMRRKRMRTGVVGIFWFWFPMLIALSCGICGLWLVIMGPWRALSSGFGYWLLGFFAYFLTMLGLVYVLTPIGVMLRYNKIGFASISIKLDWNDENMITEDKYQRSSIPWQDFSRWYENEQLFMLYFRKLVPRIIPKRILSEAQAADIRQHLQEQVGPHGATRS